MSLLDMDQVLAQTAKAVEQMNQPASPGEATREFYREQGRQQEQERILKLWDEEMSCDCKQPVWHLRQRFLGENK